MSDAEPAVVHVTDDASDAHDGGHGHEPPGEPLGPVDVATWGYAIAGGAVGLLVALVLAAARGA